MWPIGPRGADWMSQEVPRSRRRSKEIAMTDTATCGLTRQKLARVTRLIR